MAHIKDQSEYGQGACWDYHVFDISSF